jgi:hypothetical protein
MDLLRGTRNVRILRTSKLAILYGSLLRSLLSVIQQRYKAFLIAVVNVVNGIRMDYRKSLGDDYSTYGKSRYLPHSVKKCVIRTPIHRNETAIILM